MSARRARRLPLAALEPYLLEPPDPPAPLDWHAVFGNNNPAQIEVGFGKGLFLVTVAQANPRTNYVGVEIARKYQLFAATRLAKRALTNVRLIKADARQFFRDCIPAASVAAVHVYFPDPWWKQRHHKRRVFTADFARQCERILCPCGRLYFATDVEEYFTQVAAHIEAHTGFRRLPAPEERQAAHDLDYLTNFERKFRKEGRTIYRAIYECPEH
jgi:tRNA (guanine-N7-)-methyltransferase